MRYLQNLNLLRKLKKIAKILGADERKIATGRFDLVAKGLFEDDNEEDAARDELFRLLLSNESVRRVLDRHQVGDRELRDLQDVVARRIGGWVGVHYLPVHAISFPISLHFLLSHGYHEYAHKKFDSPIDEVQLAVKQFFMQGAPPSFDFERRARL